MKEWMLCSAKKVRFKANVVGDPNLICITHGPQPGMEIQAGGEDVPKMYHKVEVSVNSGLKHKLESRLPGEISVTSDMQMTPPLWQKVKKN